jgi:hypothetical protein
VVNNENLVLDFIRIADRVIPETVNNSAYITKRILDSFIKYLYHRNLEIVEKENDKYRGILLKGKPLNEYTREELIDLFLMVYAREKAISDSLREEIDILFGENRQISKVDFANRKGEVKE